MTRDDPAQIPGRRQFLLGAGAVAVGSIGWQGTARAQTERKTDIVVVGAGLAGLVAARRVADAGKEVLVLEAASRLGGRISTTMTLGSPVELGAGLLQRVNQNPLARYAQAQGLTLVPDQGDFWLTENGKDATAIAYDDLGGALDRVDRTARMAKSQGQDDSLGGRLAKEGRWSDMGRAISGPLTLGVDLGRVSSLDWIGPAGNDARIKEGMSAVIERLAAGQAVVRATPVRAIRWSGDSVLLDTVNGRVNARAAIITVSTGVLASGAITFEPALPDPVRAAIAGLPLGVLEHVGVAGKDNAFAAAPADTQAIPFANPASEAALVRLRPLGGSVAVVTFGGDYARALANQGEAALITAARERLRQVMGAQIDSKIDRAVASSWCLDPLILGARSVALPGQADARAALAKPLAGRMFFAGEATSTTAPGTLAGAWMSGEQAAADALASLS